MQSKSSIAKGKWVKCIGSSPSLFSIPLSVYADEMERVRDKNSFVKIKKLEKKCEQLREKLHAYLQQHLETLKTTTAFNKKVKGKDQK